METRLSLCPFDVLDSFLTRMRGHTHTYSGVQLSWADQGN